MERARAWVGTMIVGLGSAAPVMGAAAGSPESLAPVGSVLAALAGLGLGLAGCLDLLDSFSRTLFPEDERSFPAGRDDHALTFMPAADLADGRCAVCARSLAPDQGVAAMRVCNKCHVPMHPECWTYQGGCAIYGCRSEAPAAIGDLRAEAPAPGPESHPACR